MERQTPIICFARLATIDAAEIALLVSPPAFSPFPTVDGVLTQPGEVVLILETDEVGHFVTVGEDTLTDGTAERPRVDAVPLRTIAMILEGTPTSSGSPNRPDTAWVSPRPQ